MSIQSKQSGLDKMYRANEILSFYPEATHIYREIQLNPNKCNVKIITQL